MARRPQISVLLPAGATVALVLLHFLGQGPQPVGVASSSPASARKKTAEVDRFAGQDLDEVLRRAFKEQNMPSVLDVGQERAQKEFYKRMKVFGTSPIEIVEGEPGSELGLIIGRDGSGFARFLEQGGHFSGRLPAALAQKGSK